MKRMILAWVVLGSALLAQDEEYRNEVRFGGGRFMPLSNAGSFAFQGGYSMMSGGRIVGMDLQIKQTFTDVVGAKDVEVFSIYLPMYIGAISQSGSVRPYVAGGFGVGINSLNTGQMEGQVPGLVMEKGTATSIGFIGMAGVTVQTSNDVAFFLEYRQSFDYFYISIKNGNDEMANVGGGFLNFGMAFTLSGSL